jgi:phosphatidate cytidylyltransferase
LINSYVKRWLTGILLAAVMLAVIIFASAEILTAIITIFIIGGVWEYNRIVFGKGFLKEKIEINIFAIVIPAVVLFGTSQLLVSVLTFCILCVFILFLWSVKESTFDVLMVAKVIFGIMYIPLLTSHFILLRLLENGVYWILLVLIISIVGDTAGLYVGKYFGKNKLSVLVSPGKTIEGTIGLVSGSVLGSLIFSYFFFRDVSCVHILIISFVGSIIGQLGDLCESAIKRNYGLKDASSLLPGHGGLLDRMDSLIFIAPFVYYYRIFVIG